MIQFIQYPPKLMNSNAWNFIFHIFNGKFEIHVKNIRLLNYAYLTLNPLESWWSGLSWKSPSTCPVCNCVDLAGATTWGLVLFGQGPRDKGRLRYMGAISPTKIMFAYKIYMKILNPLKINSMKIVGPTLKIHTKTLDLPQNQTTNYGMHPSNENPGSALLRIALQQRTQMNEKKTSSHSYRP